MSVSQFISYSPVGFINEFWRELGHQAQVFYSVDICHQLFYDKGKDTLIFRSQYQVFLTNKNNFTKITRFRIPYDGPILGMAVHAEHKFLVFQTDQCQINILNCRLNKQSIFRIPKQDTAILHFEWIYQVKGSVDFVIVQTAGVHLFKIDDEKNGLKEVKFISQRNSCCWFEPKNETLVTSFHGNPGVLQTFFFNERRKDFKYKGPDFTLEDQDPGQKVNPKQSSLSTLFGSARNSKQSFTNQQFVPPGDMKNLDLSVDNQSIEQPHRIYVVNLYSKSYLLYSNSFTGRIVFYQLTFEKIIKQAYWLAFPSDIMVNLSVFDNLIVLSAVHERISIVFDIKKQKPDSPIGPPQPIEPDLTQPPTKKVDLTPINTVHYDYLIIQITEKQQQEPELQDVEDQSSRTLQSTDQNNDEYNFLTQSMVPSSILSQQNTSVEPNEVQFGFDFEGLFNDLRDSEKEKRLKDQFMVKMKWTVRPLVNEQQALREVEHLRPSQIYDKSCNYLEDEFIVDPHHKLLYQFQINLPHLPRLLDDELESFLALLRRNNCKQAVFEFLRELVFRNRQIMIFSLLYKHVFEIFSRSIHERNQRQEQSQTVEPPSDKLKNGYTILYPIDFQLSFFQPLSEIPQKVSRTYVIELLVEFIRQFNDNLKDHRVLVPSQIQNLLIKLLVKENRMPYVHFLLQYQILSDSVDFAKLLVEISSRETLEAKKLLGKYNVYPPAFQMGMDMLHRMQRYEEMLEIFFKRGMFSEAAYLLRKPNINVKIRIQSVIEGASKPGLAFTRQEIVSLFEDIHRRSKGEKLSFTTEELKTLLAN